MIPSLCGKEKLRGKTGEAQFMYTLSRTCCSFVFVLRVSRSSERVDDHGSWHSAYRFFSPPSLRSMQRKRAAGEARANVEPPSFLIQSSSAGGLQLAEALRTPTLHVAPN